MHFLEWKSMSFYGDHKPFGFPVPFASIHVYFCVYFIESMYISKISNNICIYVQICLCVNMHHTCMQGCMHACLHACVSACMHGCIHSSIWIHVPLQLCYPPWCMSVHFILMHSILFVWSLTLHMLLVTLCFLVIGALKKVRTWA